MTIARPYPERIAELERENARLKRQVDSISEYSRAHHAGTIAELERLLESTRQQYLDADHGLRIRDTECRQLRAEVGQLRFEATQLMAENANHILALDSLRTERAWLKQNGTKQAERIRELEAELARINYWHTDTSQNDLPPTRAETDAMASLADTLQSIDNEEREAEQFIDDLRGSIHKGARRAPKVFKP